jgi:hypothetical protein
LVLSIAVLVAVLGSPPEGTPGDAPRSQVRDSGGACAHARAEYEELSFEEALQSAERELASDPDRPLACLEVKALVLIVLNRLDEGREVLKELFARQPDIPLEDPSLSPAQRENIESLRENLRPMSAKAKARWVSHDALRVDVLLSGGLRDAARVRY